MLHLSFKNRHYLKAKIVHKILQCNGTWKKAVPGFKSSDMSIQNRITKVTMIVKKKILIVEEEYIWDYQGTRDLNGKWVNHRDGDLTKEESQGEYQLLCL